MNIRKLASFKLHCLCRSAAVQQGYRMHVCTSYASSATSQVCVSTYYDSPSMCLGTYASVFSNP